MRSMCAAALSLAFGLFLAFADDKKPTEAKASRSEQLAKIVKKFDKELAELKKRFEDAKTPSEKNGVREEARELATLSARDAVKLAEEDPKDSVAFDAAAFVAEKTSRFGTTKELEAMAGIVAEHHLNNPKIKNLLAAFASAGPAGEKLLKAAADKSADNQVKGLASYYLGVIAAEQLEDEEDDKKVDELIAKATTYFEKAAKAAPEATIGDPMNGITVKKAAAEQLDSLKAMKNLAVGKPAPDVEGTNLSGKKIKLSSYKGKVVLVDVWATWCGPCRSMIPHEREMVAQLKGKPFTLLSVSCDDEQENLVAFFEKEKMPWDHWFDGKGGAVAKAFRVRAFPTLYLIDATGVIRNKWVGVPPNDKLEKAVEKLVDEAIKAKG